MTQSDAIALNKLKDAILIVSAEDLKQAIRECLQEQFSHMNDNPTKQDELIGTPEACRILGCCPRTMQRYRDMRLFPFKRVGPHKVLYFKKDIEAFRDAHLIKK